MFLSQPNTRYASTASAMVSMLVVVVHNIYYAMQGGNTDDIALKAERLARDILFPSTHSDRVVRVVIEHHICDVLFGWWSSRCGWSECRLR